MNKKIRLLIVDDEPEFRELLRIILDKKGYMVDLADSGKKAIQMINRNNYDVVLTDMKMDEIGGIEVLEHIKSTNAETECIIITAYGSIENAVEAMKKGAFSYFIKSNDPQELIFDLEKIKKIKVLSHENSLLKSEFAKSEFMLQTKSESFKNTLENARKVAETDSSVLILGESGVGKEVIARYIHNESSRKSEIFMAINCYSFSDSLLESELYGHEKGAFTGSDSLRIGRFEAADKGTLFLDEIGDIPLTTQIKLLRNIGNKELNRIGSNEVLKTDFRLISATNKNLKQCIKDKTFREDFYYRISTVVIEVPPLRERKEDLSLLISYFLMKTQLELKKQIEYMDDALMNVLLNYDYPGNIRELKNIIERLVVFAEDKRISAKILRKHDILSKDEANHKESTLKAIRQVAERKYIIKILEENNADIDVTAKILNISSRQLYNKIKEYDILL